jgi:hypothetical protein
MDAVKILEKPATITWEYDEEADALYLSIREPMPAVGVDIGQGVTLRYMMKLEEKWWALP